METSNLQKNQGDPTARYSFKSLTIGTPQEINDNKSSPEKWKINLWNKEDGNVLIATLYGIDKLEVLDNAKRFQQAIDMHDELIEMIKEAYIVGDFDIAGEPVGRLGGREQEDKRILLKTKMESILKQAEQK